MLPRDPKRRSSFRNYLEFRELVTPDLIKFMYFAGALLLTISSLWTILSPDTFNKRLPTSADPMFAAVGVLIIGNLLWRMLCEAAILLFSIHERLVSLDDAVQVLKEASNIEPFAK
jgi:hypothetical protein